MAKDRLRLAVTALLAADPTQRGKEDGTHVSHRNQGDGTGLKERVAGRISRRVCFDRSSSPRPEIDGGLLTQEDLGSCVLEHRGVCI